MVKKKVDKKTDNKATDKKISEKDKIKEKDSNDKGISFNFSMKMDNEGLKGNGSFNPSEELSEEQKEILENLIKNSIQNMKMFMSPKINVQGVPRRFHNIFDFDEPRRYGSKVEFF